MQILILGDGPMGCAIATALTDRGEPSTPTGRPVGGRHDGATFRGIDVVVDASRGEAVAGNLEAALAAGVRRFVVATTGWSAQREAVADALHVHRASAVVAPNFSLGVALFARLVDVATDLFGAIDTFDPYLVEWHRRAKSDRPSGTALVLADRIASRHPRLATAGDLETASIRAGACPGMHLVGFDAAGESIELRITARDRTAYAAGVLTAIDWVHRTGRPSGIHGFDAVIDDLLEAPPMAA